jgi:ribosomal protein S18 acetylase RimI-like enzyme
MRPTRLNLSATALPGQIQANLIAYFRLFAGLPGMHMRDDDTFWFIGGEPAPGNSILRARWSNPDVEKRLDATFAEVGQYMPAIDWLVFPTDAPADLNQRLEARGMPGGPGGNWLWTDLTALGLGPAVPAGFHVERVADDRAMRAWLAVSEAGFGEALGCFYDAYTRHGYGPEAFSLHYIGYVGDVAVTSATLLDAGGTAALYDISTPAAFRRQGFGGALTHALMRAIRARGYDQTWIWSSDMARPLYQALGFLDADFGVREHRWRRA